jgi:hypothetical protein
MEQADYQRKGDYLKTAPSTSHFRPS